LIERGGVVSRTAAHVAAWKDTPVASRWKWFLGGGLCGFFGAVSMLLVVALLTMTIPWNLLYQESSEWVTTELDESVTAEQVDAEGNRDGDTRTWTTAGRRVEEGRYRLGQ
jgi:hypothetical protein